MTTSSPIWTASRKGPKLRCHFGHCNEPGPRNLGAIRDNHRAYDRTVPVGDADATTANTTTANTSRTNNYSEYDNNDSTIAIVKNSGTCTKCNQNKILRIEGKIGAYGVGNNIRFGLTIFNAVKVTRYLCTGCGFSEEWIDDPASIAKLEEKFG